MDFSEPTPATGEAGAAIFADGASLLQVALDSAHQGIVLFDADLRILAHNQPFMDLLGRGRLVHGDQNKLTECLALLEGLTSTGRQHLEAWVTETAIKGAIPPDHAVRLETGQGPPMYARLKPVADGRWSLQLETAPSKTMPRA